MKLPIPRASKAWGMPRGKGFILRFPIPLRCNFEKYRLLFRIPVCHLNDSEYRDKLFYLGRNFISTASTKNVVANALGPGYTAPAQLKTEATLRVKVMLKN